MGVIVLFCEFGDVIAIKEALFKHLKTYLVGFICIPISVIVVQVHINRPSFSLSSVQLFNISCSPYLR